MVVRTGLRERKKDATRNRLRAAALLVASREGFERATVDLIAEAADVAPRTFFNYFAEKEDALVGIDSGLVADAVASAQSAESTSPDAGAGAVVALLVKILVGAVERTPGGEERRQIVRDTPELLDWMILHLARRRVELRGVVQSLLGPQDPAVHLDDVLVNQVFWSCLGAVAVRAKEAMADDVNGFADRLIVSATKVVEETASLLRPAVRGRPGS